jgi:CheY-like chemotaxis protein
LAGGFPDVLECHILLPAWQAEGLFHAATARGTTAGQLVRRLIGEFLAWIGPGSDGGAPDLLRRSAMGDLNTRLRVLAVDDDATTRDLIVLLVRMAGHDARSAPDGFSALELAADYRPEVVLVDAVLPGMDGWELIRRLRADTTLGGAHIVCITGLVGEDERRRSGAAGCDDHWVKPFEPEKLHGLLAALTTEPGRRRADVAPTRAAEAATVPPCRDTMPE